MSEPGPEGRASTGDTPVPGSGSTAAAAETIAADLPGAADGGDRATTSDELIVLVTADGGEEDEDDSADGDPDDDAEDGGLGDDDAAAQDPFAALGALFGGGGSNPLAGLLEQAQQMQAGLQDAQRRLAEQTVSGTSGGGLVRATVSGTGELMALRIDPSVVDPADVDTLVDLVVAAVRAATADARALNDRTMSGAVPDFGGLTADAAGPGAVPGFGFGGGTPGFAGMPDLDGVPDFGSMPGFGTVPDLRRIPGAGPLAGPAGDDPDDDDLGPAGGPAGV